MATVLLVEQDRGRARLTAWALEPHHTVETTQSLRAAAARSREIGADVVILNTRLYEGDQSDELLRAIVRGLGEPPRVIAVQEYGARRAETMPAPVDAILTPPFDADDLLKALHRVLSKPQI